MKIILLKPYEVTQGNIKPKGCELNVTTGKGKLLVKNKIAKLPGFVEKVTELAKQVKEGYMKKPISGRKNKKDIKY